MQAAAERVARRGDVEAVDEDEGYRAHSEQTDENERAESGDRLTSGRFCNPTDHVLRIAFQPHGVTDIDCDSMNFSLPSERRSAIAPRLLNEAHRHGAQAGKSRLQQITRAHVCGGAKRSRHNDIARV